MIFDYNILNLYNGDIQIKKKIKKRFKINCIKKYFFKITFNSVNFSDDRGITNVYEWMDYFNKLKDEPFNFTKHSFIYVRINGNPPSYVYLHVGSVKIVASNLVLYVCNKMGSNKFYSRIPQGRFIHTNFSFSDSFHSFS